MTYTPNDSLFTGLNLDIDSSFNGVPVTQADTTPATPASQLPPSPVTGLNPYLIPDGFSYNVHLKHMPYRGYPMQLRLLDQYRREALQGKWQPRWYGVPLDVSVPIAAGDTISPLIRIARGSIVWGATLAVLAPASVSDIRIVLRDTCRDAPLISQNEIGLAFRANFAAGTPSSGFTHVFLSGGPLRLSGDEMDVVMVNTNTTTSVFAQLLLMMLEPIGVPS